MDFIEDVLQRLAMPLGIMVGALAMPLGIMVGALIATHVLTAIK